MIHLCGNFATCRPAPRRDRIRYIAGKKDSAPRARTGTGGEGGCIDGDSFRFKPPVSPDPLEG